MENASYALYLAVGVLVGILILSLLVFRWKQIGSVESAKDESVVIKNRADFNAEYEAFNKKLMYGTDVLSCLNKAQNNNQKYVYNNYYGTDMGTLGKESREEFFIDVLIKINTTLCDSVKAYTKDNTGKYKRVIGLTASDQPYYSNKVFLNTSLNYFKSPTVNYYYFEKGNVKQKTGNYIDIMWANTDKSKTLYNILNTGKIDTKFIAKTSSDPYYHLLTQEDTSSSSSLDETAKLAALISTVSLKEQSLFKNPQPTDSNDWWYCTWTTAASDFKTRKFKCTGVEYNQNHGYIEKIVFEEISN